VLCEKNIVKFKKLLLLESQYIKFSNKNLHEYYPQLQASVLKISGKSSKNFLSFVTFIKHPLLGAGYNISGTGYTIFFLVRYNTSCCIPDNNFFCACSFPMQISTNVSPSHFEQELFQLWNFLSNILC